MKKIILFLFLSFQYVCGQIENWNIAPPINPVTTLSGSYLEMRRNHFHGGIDLRTGGMEGLPVHALDDGYVSQIQISARNYGKSVCITYPNGYTSLYGHLSGFVPKLDSIVKSKQYAEKSFEIILDLEPDKYPVKKDEVFAYSGNTGASAGPHLHFEIRKSDRTLVNPLLLNEYFKIEDNRAPRISGVKVYGMNHRGVVNGASEKKMRAVVNNNRTRSLQGAGNLTAWGEIGFSVNARDYMTGTGFSYTPRLLKLYVDEKLVSDIDISNVNYGVGRDFNSFVDYPEVLQTREFYMKSFKDPGSPLQVYKNTEYKGIYKIDEERSYPVRYEVYDDFGLKDVISFVIQGKKTVIPEPKEIYDTIFTCREAHVFENEEFMMYFPEDALYTDVGINYKRSSSPKFYSSVHRIGDVKVPIHPSCDVSIKITRDSVKDKRKYFIAKLNADNLITASAGGTYVNGFMIGKVGEFGRFAVAADTGKPGITVLNINNLTKRPYLRFKIYDGLSGIKSYDGYIDDEWVLFDYDAKTQMITYVFDKKRVQRNKKHKFKLMVADNCGNVAMYENTIYW